MGAIRTDDFTLAQNELADVFRALAHPARVAIVQHLLSVNQCIGGEIVDVLPLAQPTISRHLKELKAVGLIKGNISGTRVHYCINASRWREVQHAVNGLFDTYVLDQECC